MKATANFKLSKTSKMMIANKLPPRNHYFRHAMIEAELAAAIRPRSNKADRNTLDKER